jgi:hypothetical protein
MKVSELMVKLAEMAQDADVVVFDMERNSYHADGDGTSEGVYPVFELEVIEMFSEEREQPENFLALSFKSDYVSKENYALNLEKENNKFPETFTESQISKLQSAVYEITGKGEVMALFNGMRGICAG